MIIKELILNNFGIYARKNTYTFRNEKPIVLVGGLNGRGKTTFLEAVLLALYGPKSFAFEESRQSAYSKYLHSYVNAMDGTKESYVEMTFSLQNPEDIYRIKRSWNAKKIRSKETVEVYHNDQYDTFLTDNWGMFIENEVPSALSRFFFFDGEKISGLIEEKMSEQMKHSIKSLLGIVNVEKLDHDLSKLVKQASKASNLSESQEAEELQAELDQKSQELVEIERQISEKNEKQEEINHQIELADVAYKNAGGDLFEERESKNQQKVEYSNEVYYKQQQLREIASAALPLLLVRNLLETIKEEDQKEHDEKVGIEALSYIEKMKAGFTLKGSEDVLNKFLNHIKSKISDGDPVDYIYDLSEESRYQLNQLLNHQFDETKEQVRALKEEIKLLNARINEIDQYLALEIKNVDIEQYSEQLKSLSNISGKLEGEINVLDMKKNIVSKEIGRLKIKHSKVVESLLGKLEEFDDNERVIQYSHLAKKILEKYKLRLQDMKLKELSDTVTDCYKALANKTNLIEQIVVDPNSLELTYYNASDEIVSPLSLSAGEKQLMIISLLWALAICAKNKLPVIIDTPLSRLDSDHRLSLIERYFPNASKQTIILSTDTEIDEYYFDKIKENVGDMFTLIYDDETKATHIAPGYFGWEKNDCKTD